MSALQNANFSHPLKASAMSDTCNTDTPGGSSCAELRIVADPASVRTFTARLPPFLSACATHIQGDLLVEIS